jgi:ABC-type amino acid transport system permease subunit
MPEMIGSTGLAFSAAAGRGRGNQKARRQQTQSTTQRLLANAAKSTAPTSFPAGGSAAVRGTPCLHLLFFFSIFFFFFFLQHVCVCVCVCVCVALKLTNFWHSCTAGWAR